MLEPLESTARFRVSEVKRQSQNYDLSRGRKAYRIANSQEDDPGR